MAIAGSTLDVFNIRPIDGELRIINKTRIAGHLACKDPQKALAELKRRGQVTLWSGDDNWMKLKTLWDEGNQR